MFLRFDRGTKSLRKRGKRPVLAMTRNSKRFGVEGLEERCMFSGVVDVLVAPGTVATPVAVGNLVLMGDGGGNNVTITATSVSPTADQYTISAGDTGGQPTLFELNGGGQTFSTLTVDNIFGNITVALGGDSTFAFTGTGAPGGVTNIPGNLTITNGPGTNSNTLNSVLVNGNLAVTEAATAAPQGEDLYIVSSTIIGNTVVNNFGNGAAGQTLTKIDGSTLEGDASENWALLLKNGAGFNVTTVLDASQFGTGAFDGLQPIVEIVNGAGGSQTTFTGTSQTAGPGTTTVYGAMLISNGSAPQLDTNIVTFTSVNVLGWVTLDNDYLDMANVGTDVITTVGTSTLGSQLANPSLGPNPASGGPLAIFNGPGYDQFSMTGSTLPWGLYITNDNVDGGSPAKSTWGSSTQITSSFIGTGLALGLPVADQADPLAAGMAFELIGDEGADIVNLTGTEFVGETLLTLLNGNNSATISASTTMTSLFITSAIGNTSVTINNSSIAVAVSILLGDGANNVTLENENFNSQFPSPLLGGIDIDGGVGGVNTLTETDDTGALEGDVDFEIVNL